jgi:hypothetical protein
MQKALVEVVIDGVEKGAMDSDGTDTASHKPRFPFQLQHGIRLEAPRTGSRERLSGYGAAVF